MKVLFLDIDGVVNFREIPYDGDAPTISNKCIRYLNKIIRSTGAKIVLSSSWRGLIHERYMTEWGFWKMLCTHGMTPTAELIGVTRASKTNDYDYPDYRHHQIQDWLRETKENVTSFVILDDCPVYGYDSYFVQTSDATGLTEADADRAIEILGKSNG